MRQSSLRFLMSLSAAATLWGAGVSLACAQAAPGQNAPTPGPVMPEAPDTATTQPMPEGSAGYQPPPSYTTTTETPAFTISDPNEPVIDARTTRTRRPNVPLLTTGTSLFLLAYLPTVITQAAKDRNDNLYIPIAGPWMDLADNQQSTAEKTLLSLSGVLQGLGALGVVSSFFVPERRTRNWYLIGGGTRRAFSVSPQVGRAMYGVGAQGRF
jgi:hypothetical protein